MVGAYLLTVQNARKIGEHPVTGQDSVHINPIQNDARMKVILVCLKA
jgi:hypothetical protein